MVTTKTTCDLDMSYFPFDIQTCHIKMYIIGNNKFDFTLYVEWDTGTVSESRNGAWTLVGKNYSVDDNLEMIDLELSFERRPLFLLLNIFLPIIVLALLTPIVFALPKHSGERVGYSITMLLAISVYMTIISDNLPQNSDPMPLVSIMMFIWYILDSAIVFIVIINTKIYNIKENKPVPLLARKFVHLTRIITCEKAQNENETSEGKGESQSTEANTEDCSTALDRDDCSSHANIKWSHVSTAIDKWFFVISYAFKILIPIIFFSMAKANSKPPEN
ncbi:acetylcholine receptor subunit delta-like [Mercenaria mercenaria]|uniref:acetylcholine receptor subunit delta-like n=1 Tax=Mercenaria mercenaria TaxID=6596 RepID=UPI00234FB321|nr:acetylcholine receptor subunit delta-like [Mercenaria mercenaria]